VQKQTIFHTRKPSVLLLFGLMTLLHLAPIWTYDYFATQDGPSHLYNSRVMLDLYTTKSPIFNQYYVLQTSFAGNLVSQLILIPLLAVASAPLTLKIFLSLYVILFCGGFWYAVSSINSGSRWIAFLIFPFVYSSWLHLGFFNFLLGTAFFFFLVGYFIRRQDNLRFSQIVIMALLFLLLFFSHIMAFGAGVLLVMGVVTVALALQFVEGRVTPRTWILPALAIIPSGILLWMFLQRYMHGLYPIENLRLAAWRIYSIAPIGSGSDIEFGIAKALAVLIAALAVGAGYLAWKRGRLFRSDAILLAALVFLTLSVVAPKAVNTGGYIRLRMVYLFFPTLILWISTQSIPKRVSRTAAALSVAISALLFVSRVPIYNELDRQIQEYLSVEPHVAPNTTLLALSFAGHGYRENALIGLSDDPSRRLAEDPALRVAKVYSPFEHLSAWLGMDKPVVDLGNYEATIPAFWTQYRSQVNPFVYIDEPFETLQRPFVANLFGYPPESGGQIDYVLLWGLDGKGRREIMPPRLRDQLTEAYDLIYMSTGRGLVQLYRLKNNLDNTAEIKALPLSR
jgi:hypothetical protein